MRLSPFAFCAALLTATLIAADAETQSLPPAFVRLLPAGASLDAEASEWDATGTAVTGGLRAKFPGTPRNCFRTESQLDLELTGESSLPPDVVSEMAQEAMDQALSGLAEEARNRGRKGGTGSLDVVSVGEITREKLGHGFLAYYEYTEKCDSRANAKVASLRGFSRKGAILLSFHLLMNTGIADARTKAIEVLDAFAKLDIEAAKRNR